ncbi:MAG: hypothetical protein J6Q16_03410 [Clostridia bacterium]|nr:hypothetical protein [Clostridia bacterium]
MNTGRNIIPMILGGLILCIIAAGLIFGISRLPAVDTDTLDAPVSPLPDTPVGDTPQDVEPPATDTDLPDESGIHLILNADGSYGGTLYEPKYGTGAPLNGKYDHPDSEYYILTQDYYNMSSTPERLIFPQFSSYQQTMRDSSGLACLLMILNYMGEDVHSEYTELALLQKYEEVNQTTVFGSGTTEEGLIKLIDSLGLGYTATNAVSGYSGGFTKDNMDYFFCNAILDGKFVLVRYQSSVGHGWKVVIGYDNLGNIKNTLTGEELDHFGDDVMIFAEPYDGWDHKQDGYATERAQDFYAWWKTMSNDGKISNEYSFVIVDTGLDIKYDLQPVDETVRQPVYDNHLPRNPDGTYGGTRDEKKYGQIISGRGWWDHLEADYYKRSDFYNMGSLGSRVLLKNYTVLQQTMRSSCGNCAVNGILSYYGDERDPYELEELYVTLYEEVNDTVVKGRGTGAASHKKALAQWGYEAKVYGGSASKKPTFGSYYEYMKFMRDTLKQGHPIAVAINLGSGHYLTVIGVDDMGTVGYIYDDVIITADSCDYWDHCQDGYNLTPAYKFYSQHTNGRHTTRQSCLVIYPK